MQGSEHLGDGGGWWGMVAGAVRQLWFLVLTPFPLPSKQRPQSNSTAMDNGWFKTTPWGCRHVASQDPDKGTKQCRRRESLALTLQRDSSLF